MPTPRLGLPDPPANGQVSAGLGDDWMRAVTARLEAIVARVDDPTSNDPRAPAGPAGGDLAGFYPNPQISAAVLAGVFAPGDLLWSFASSRIGFLPFDGASHLVTTYASLSAIVRPIFGGVDLTHFTLPNLKGRTLVIAGAGSGLTSRSLGQLFGAETVAITVAQLPVHNHPVTDPGHNHTKSDPGHNHFVNDPSHQHAYDRPQDAAFSGAGAGGGAQRLGEFFATVAAFTGITLTASTTGITFAPATTGVSVGNQGSNQGHDNVQPSVAANLFIKT